MTSTNPHTQPTMTYTAEAYDIIVVGAGHAGCEAAVAAAKLGMKTALFTLHIDSLANLPCNPSIGGTAKGQLVREIDALGGVMGKIADETAIQTRMLNRSKGAAVFSPRAQIDRRAYGEKMRELLENQTGLSLRQDEIVALAVDREAQGEKKSVEASTPTDLDPTKSTSTVTAHEDSMTKLHTTQKVIGVLSAAGGYYPASAVILCTGTYMESRVIRGESIKIGGPDGLSNSQGLSENLASLGLPMLRFKTGTPVRIHADSIAYDQIERQDGEIDNMPPFSFENEMNGVTPTSDQLPCWIAWTTPETKAVIRENLHRSPLYSGVIEGVGPRYCPSIEDKFVKFPDKERHQAFVEPMGRQTKEMYLQGMSSSMPEDVQLRVVRSVTGLADAKIQRFAYAIEYDCVDPTGLLLSLESKYVSGLFMAGQINGSSGYEEAAGQGLVAGVNAVRKMRGQEPMILDRSVAYIGVLIDDLVTKGTQEPYRMMTSRAEYRLSLRQDDADRRLMEIGYQVGLVSEDLMWRVREKYALIEAEKQRLSKTFIAPSVALTKLLTEAGSTPPASGISLGDLLKRPGVRYADLAPVDSKRPDLPPYVIFTLETDIKYEGYIRLERDRIERFRVLEQKRIPENMDYTEIRGLRIEAQQKLTKMRPESVGQASRISGVSPADIAVLLVYIDAYLRKSSDSRNDEEGQV